MAAVLAAGVPLASSLGMTRKLLIVGALVGLVLTIRASSSAGDPPRAREYSIGDTPDGRLRIMRAPVQVRGMTGEPADAMQPCVEAGALAIAAPAPGDPDIAAYAIHLSLAIY